MNKKSLLSVGVLVMASMFLIGGCVPTQTAPANIETATSKDALSSRTGTVVESGGKYILQAPGSPPLSIDSYTIDFSQYVGQNVTVTGRFSGDTLFGSEIE